MSENEKKSLPFVGGAMFVELSPEEAAAWRIKLDKEAAERRVYVAEKILTLPENALPLEEKRALAGEILASIVGTMPEGRLAEMTEEELNSVFVVAADWETACANFDDEAFDAAMAADRAAAAKPTPKP